MQSDIRGDRTGYAVVGEAKIAGLQAPKGQTTVSAVYSALGAACAIRTIS
jgi:hypothetical protein